jgi:hypothetical protein
MVDEQRGKRGTRRLFHLGESYGDLGPGLGWLYAAWRVGKGRPALMLRPGEDVEWRPEGPWRVCISCDPEEDSVTLDVKRAPAAARLVELANLLVLMAAAVERVEENARVQAHLARGPVILPEPWSSRARRVWSAPALAGVAMFALGLGVGMSVARGPLLSDETVPGMDSQTFTLAGAQHLPVSDESDAGTIAYPLPAKPLVDQATAPCNTRRFEVDINGGCWVELAHRPPCLEDVHAEYQGKCYLPVAKRTRLPQAVAPLGQ